MMCLKKSLAVSSSLILVEQGINIPYFVNLSTMTRMLSKPFDSGNSRIKSIVIISKGWEGIGIGHKSPTGACHLGFDFWHMLQVLTKVLILLDIWGQ